MSFGNNYVAYLRKLEDALTAHDLAVDHRALVFSNGALSAVEAGDWGMAAGELRDLLRNILAGKLSSSHQFLEHPYVRRIELPGHGEISVTIVNNQSRDWYGAEHVIGAFDFLPEARRGVFQDCRRFLDLGGHQRYGHASTP